MRPAEAEGLLETCDYLSVPERLVFVFLLRRGDNLDCSIPTNLTPRLALISKRCGIAERTLRRYLQHLHLHGWIYYQPGRGAGRKSQMNVAPRVPDVQCRCVKVSHLGKKAAPAGAVESGPSGGRHKVAPHRSRAAGQTVSVQEARKRNVSEEDRSPKLVAVPLQRASGDGTVRVGRPHLSVVKSEPRHVCETALDSGLARSEAEASVVSIRRPLTRSDYPSTWCEQADRLWSQGYDA